jgi:streptomycin 6-kinase
MVELPAEFINTIISVNGKAGEQWLAGMDELIAYCKHKWQFELLPVRKLSFNFIAPVLFVNGSKAVLKLAMPGKGTLAEIATLKAYDGDVFCKLLDAEPAKGIMLLECIEPGEPLAIVPDDIISTTIVAQLIKDMQQVNTITDHLFQTANDWYAGLISLQVRFGNAIIPGYLFNNALAAYQSIQFNPQKQRLLHGDLHQENILLAGNDCWKIIDPKEIIAETGCELIPFLMNKLEGKDVTTAISGRIEVFSDELKVKKDRIIQWGSFRSVLSAYWKIEDNLKVTSKDLIICEVFYEMSR